MARPKSALELTELQLYHVANDIKPEEWMDLGARLGFCHPEIQRMKAENRSDMKAGIFKMLVTWMKIQPDVTQMAARKFLADKFNDMGRRDLAVKLINTEVNFVAPHRTSGDESSVEFDYSVQSFQEDKDISFQCSLVYGSCPLSLEAIIKRARDNKEFRDKLSVCFHLLGSRLTRIRLLDNFRLLQCTVTVLDVEGVRTLKKNLTNSDQFKTHLTGILSECTSEMQAAYITISFKFDDHAFEEAIAYFKQEEEKFASGTAPPRVSDIELVTLAKHIGSDLLHCVGLGLGLRAAEVETLLAQNLSKRVATENMLFTWKQGLHPVDSNRTKLVTILANAGLRLLGEKLKEGEFRERGIEAQRRIYLHRYSAPCSLKGFMNPTYFRHPAAPPNPPPSDELLRQPSSPTEPPPESREHDYESKIVRVVIAHPKPPEDLPEAAENNPDYESVVGEGSRDHDYENVTPPREHDYENVAHLREGQISRKTTRVSWKRFGEPTIPAIHSLDLSVLDDTTWDTLANYDVTQSNIKTAAGLKSLAIALDDIQNESIADTVWAALIKDHIQQSYLTRFVTGTVELKARVITNDQDVDTSQNVSLEELFSRTKELQFPCRIFIEADVEADRDLVAQKIGYDWANERDPRKPLGNVDLLFVLQAQDIASGSTVGGAIVKQCLGGDDFGIESHRVGDYLANTSTEVVIVLNCHDDTMARLMCTPSPRGQGSAGKGLKDLIVGDYLGNCIVVMTTVPEAQVKNFAHYKMIPTSSMC